MIDIPFEEMTAAEAVNAGLIDALKNGEVKISGTYEITAEGKIEYDQNNFVFKDKGGYLRLGKFKDTVELTEFATKILQAKKKRK